MTSNSIYYAKKVKLNERFEKCNRFRKGISLFTVVVLWMFREFKSIAQIGFMNNVVQLSWSMAWGLFRFEGGGWISSIIQSIQQRWNGKCFNYYLIVVLFVFNDFGASFFNVKFPLLFAIAHPLSLIVFREFKGWLIEIISFLFVELESIFGCIELRGWRERRSIFRNKSENIIYFD
jgi:hypothetical protein